MAKRQATEMDHMFMKLAYEEAAQGYAEGGVPVGCVMSKDDKLIARGHNRRVQHDDPISHGETDCLLNAGIRDDYRDIDLYTTLSPCMMCTGAILHFGIKRLVIGENKNFPGNIEFLTERGVEVVVLDDAKCTQLMARFIRERPDIWFEDIAGNEQV
ncbi:MAG: nucleoside deaminase [Gammaproteobacteria bacterium]|nr:nucleoside deaminase [Gammaproteobacteria bacterium]